MKGLILYLLIPLVHPNHVSVTDIVFNNKTETLEITISLFPEDVENVVRKYKEPEFILDERTKNGLAKEFLVFYLNDHFKLSNENSPIPIKYLGMEINDEIVHCYMESAHIENPTELKVENTVLFDLQDEQVNFNHFKSEGKIRSVKTTVETPVAEIKS